MKEILLTSSALILALLLVRRVFREKISRRVQYALWGLVLLRLLVPVQLPAADFSVLSVSEPATARMEERLEENPVYVLPVPVQESPNPYASARFAPEWWLFLQYHTPIKGHQVLSEDEKSLQEYVFTLQEALDLVWKTGMACMGLWLVASNLRFWRMLRKTRIPLELPECRYPVYLVESGLVSPCLFGLFRPAVYLTPAALENEDGLRHVLAHEETHGRQWDPLWSLLRGVCLAVYWFDPLVWWAAAAAKEDCELACDEGALRRLGEEQRIPYGQTLLRLIPLKKSAAHVMLTATTMTSDKKRMKERIMRIAENRKMKVAALCAALAATVAVCAVTFTGCAAEAKQEPPAPADSPKVEAPVEPSAEPPVEPAQISQPVEPEPEPEARPVQDVELMIPLTDLQPVELQKVDVISADTVYGGHHGEEHHSEAHLNTRCIGSGAKTTGDCGIFSWTYGDMTYVSSYNNALSSFPDDYFLCFERADCMATAFTDVLGHSGVAVEYLKTGEDSIAIWVTDYYVFDENGDVYLLARVYGIPEIIDLDGDGVNELIGTDNYLHAQIFFQRDGRVYEASIPELLRHHWGQDTQFMFTGWYSNERCLRIYGLKPVIQGGQAADTHTSFYRDTYFNGESLIVCKTPRGEMRDHVLSSIQDVSTAVDTARAAAKVCADAWTAEYGKDMENPPVWDDYCVTELEWAYPMEFKQGQPENGPAIAVYQYSYEVHTTTPERVNMLAGGAYLDEDGWVGKFYDPNKQYLVFQILDDGSYKQLEGQLPDDYRAGSDMFMRALERLLKDNGLT